MRKSLAFTTLCLMLMGPTAFAEKGKKEMKDAKKQEMKKEMFEVTKKESLSNLEQRIQHLQQTKSCVSGASDNKALKACRQEARKKGEMLRAEMKQKRKERMAKRKDRMAKRKN